MINTTVLMCVGRSPANRFRFTSLEEDISSFLIASESPPTPENIREQEILLAILWEDKDHHILLKKQRDKNPC